MKLAGPALWLVGLFWSALTLGFDLFTARALVGQWQSTRYAKVDGRILESAVTTERDDDTNLHGVAVRYEYRVDGRRYESTRVRFSQASDSEGRWARETVRDNPAGAVRPVYYDRAHPEQAVLQPGLRGAELFLTLFLSPFNVVMLGIWWMGMSSLLSPPPHGGAVITPVNSELRVRFPGLGVIGGALAVFGFVAFLAALAICFTAGFSPGLGTVLTGWAIALLAAGASAIWGLNKKLRNAPDVVVNLERSTLTRLRWTGSVPSDLTPAERRWLLDRSVVVPLERIRSIDVEQRASGKDGSATMAFDVVMNVTGEDGKTTERVGLSMWYTAGRAEAFAAWLRTTLGLA